MVEHILTDEEIEELICAKFGWYCTGCKYQLKGGDCRIDRDGIVLSIDKQGTINEQR